MKKVKQASSSSREKLSLFRAELDKCFFERTQVIDGLLATMIHGGNALLLGPPGTAKSELVHVMCSAIEESSYFNRLLFKTMPPEELLGPISIKEMTENDRLVRNTKGRLPSADVAVLDEIFKCSPATLNSLLRIANEREFDNPEPKKVPLLFLVGASNEVPTEPEMLAFLDRFTFKAWVGPLKNVRSRKELAKMAETGKRRTPTQRFKISEIKAMRDEAMALPFHPLVIEQLLSLSSEFTAKNLYFSDRKIVKVIELIKCFAFVHGADKVVPAHLHELLPFCVAVQEEDMKSARTLIKGKFPSLVDRVIDWHGRAQKCVDEVRAEAQRYSNASVHAKLMAEDRLARSIEMNSRMIHTLRSQLVEAMENEEALEESDVRSYPKAMDNLLLDAAKFRDLITSVTVIARPHDDRI